MAVRIVFIVLPTLELRILSMKYFLLTVVSEM